MEYSKVEELLGDWGPKLRKFIESPEFDKIYEFLKQQSREGRTICPESKNVFRAFKECPYDNLKCIFILQDPYSWVKNNVYTADGIAISCRNTGYCQPSLDLFYEGIEDDLKIKVPREPDLTYLANQGILFLNTSLTVEMNKPNSHKGVWTKFTEYLIEEAINMYNRGLVYVSFGKEAIPASKLVVPFLHWGFEIEHPAAAAHKDRKWNHQNIFSRINTIMKNNNNHKINWSYEENRG